MTEAEARAQLERMIAHTTFPVLSVADVDTLIALAKRPDSEGREPTDIGWVPTWNLDAAAATGWEWKAGRTSGDFNFGEDGQRFDRAQVHQHCLAMADMYGRHRGRSGSITITSILDTTA